MDEFFFKHHEVHQQLTLEINDVLVADIPLKY